MPAKHVDRAGFVFAASNDVTVAPKQRAATGFPGDCLRFSHQQMFKEIGRNARPFFGTVPSIFPPQMFKKQDGMLTFFWYCAPDVLTENVSQTRRNAGLVF